MLALQNRMLHASLDMPRNSIIKIQHLSCWRNHTLLSRLRIILSIQLQYCVCVCVSGVWCIDSEFYPFETSPISGYKPPSTVQGFHNDVDR